MHDRLDMEGAERTVLDLPLEVKADGAPGSFEGYGAVFGNTDRDGDVVAKGAFADSLKGRMPALLWQHNPKEPIGRFDVVKEDAKGLYVKGRLSMSGKGKEAYDLLKLGALNGLSIGFVTKEALRNRATGTRTIKSAELMEISLVTFPANELARVQSVKQVQTMEGDVVPQPAADIETPRDFERMLRDAGFSRARAKAITAKGFRGGTKQLDSDLAEVVRTIAMSQDRIEQKAASSTTIRIFEGRTATGWLPSHMPKSGMLNIRIVPPHRYARFICNIDFIEGDGGGVVERNIQLYQDEGLGFRTSVKVPLHRRNPRKWPGLGRIIEEVRRTHRIKYELDYKSSTLPVNIDQRGTVRVKRKEAFKIIIS